MKVLIFRIGSYMFAVETEKIRYLVYEDGSISCFSGSEIDVNQLLHIEPFDITKRLLIEEVDSAGSSLYLYYKAPADDTRCLVINSSEGIKEFDESELFYSKEELSSTGIIGHVNYGKSIISLIDISEFLSFCFTS